MTLSVLKFILSILIVFGSLNIIGQEIQNQPSLSSKKPNFSNPKLTYKIIESINGTWGYDILNEEKTMIHQASVPGKDGLEGFKTKEQSILVANAIIEKINKGIKPPSISLEEMKLLGAL